MTRFFFQRLAICVVTVMVGSLLTFGALYLAPGDPVDFLLGNRPSTPEQRAALTEMYHLNSPPLERYLAWISGLLHGDLGTSIQQGQPVADLIKAALPTTIILVLLTFGMVLALGVLLGGLAALRAGWVDDGVSVFMNVSVATPAFVAAIGLISVFAVQLGWFPVFGQGTGVGDRVHHLMLPAIALAIGWWPIVGSVTRSSMREELAREHVSTAVSRGIPRRQVIRRHVFRNAQVPVMTAAGLAFAGLVTGTAIVETVFQLNGLGGLLITSVAQKDFAVAQAIAMIVVAVFAVTNLLVDTAAAVLDPRIRAGRVST